MKSRNHVILRPMYVFHNLLELTQAYVFFSGQQKMFLIKWQLFFLQEVFTMPWAFYFSKDRTVHETCWKLTGIMRMVKQRATAVCSPCSDKETYLLV